MNDSRLQILSAWTGLVGLVLFGIGLVAAGMLPPPRPASTAQEIATLYRSHATGIKAGSALVIMAGAFLCAFAGSISAQMRAMERGQPVLTYIQLACGAMGSLAATVGGVTIGVGAFRADRSAESILLMNDLSFIMIVMPIVYAVLQLLAIGILILGKSMPSPIFKPWIGYLNIWAAIALLPGLAILFFQRGPFAWNGLLTFWLGAGVVVLWALVMTRGLIQAARDGEPTSNAGRAI